jgi:glycosyltransferase involved in cell wall biosynthesis
MPEENVLFISHDASRTGAPIVFLNFLRWFKQNTDISFKILLRRSGELEPDFAALAPTFVFDRPQSKSLWQRVTKRLGLNKSKNDPIVRLQQHHKRSEIKLIFSNTATNGQLLQALSFLQCPVISHIHELEYSIHYCNIDGLQSTKFHTDHYIACANDVKTNLVERHSIAPSDISVIHEFIPLAKKNSGTVGPTNQYLRQKLDLPDNAFIVGASGTTDWRKGVDLFIQLAFRVCFKIEAPIHFVWLGGGQNRIQMLAVNHDVENLGLKSNVHFIGSQPNPLDYFAGFDLFALTSREDPFPLVCLEAASLGKPIVCFDKAGGEPEFVETDCGYIVPYLNIEVMAECVIELYQNPERCQQFGRNAAQKVRDRHLLEENAPKILALIEKYFR